MARWGRMEANRCLKIHPNVLAALGRDPLFLGCSRNVLPLLDSKCSGRPECEVHIPDPQLDEVKPCYQDLKSFLTASYSCVRGMIYLLTYLYPSSLISLQPCSQSIHQENVSVVHRKNQ